MAFVFAIQGVVDKETFEELRGDITAVDVARLFINAAYKILDGIDTLMSIPPSPRPLTFPLLLVSHTDSSFCSGIRREQPAVDFDKVGARTPQLM